MTDAADIAAITKLDSTPTARDIVAAKALIRARTAKLDDPDASYRIAYAAFLNVQMARLADDRDLLDKTLLELRTALGFRVVPQQARFSQRPA